MNFVLEIGTVRVILEVKLRRGLRILGLPVIGCPREGVLEDGGWGEDHRVVVGAQQALARGLCNKMT